ncbi:MAG TPA: metabolite traffic protein EboE [Planctomycetaceae bacterium]|jgi:sugar phosphate isomerase/epimerase|nr:metabolite traffic protein EboE [Planctomycetaceae bacterium]
MSFSALPLSYCTNVHPGRTLGEIIDGLDRFTVPVAARLGSPLAAGLWLAAPVIKELQAAPDGGARFAEALRERGLSCHTLNAFPFGDFHSPRVKENVYVPSWAEQSRLDYTLGAARTLAELLPADEEGSISTLPLGYPGIHSAPDFLERCVDNLLATARELDRIQSKNGRTIRLGLEPEPCCWLDTTPSAIAFFTDRLWPAARKQNCLDAVRTHIGLCFDVCHQAVAFEDVGRSIVALDEAGIRLNKIHITCAIELRDPATNQAARAALAQYAEPRYLHQTKARTLDGRVLTQFDLEPTFALEPPAEFLMAPIWRTHFHVPVDAERLGPLATTRAELRAALAAVRGLPYAPHLEVETYTWDVMPGSAPRDLVDGLTGELSATRTLLAELSK